MHSAHINDVSQERDATMYKISNNYIGVISSIYASETSQAISTWISFRFSSNNAFVYIGLPRPEILDLYTSV